MVNDGQYFGVVPEIVQTLARKLNFSIEVETAYQWGSLMLNGSWTGMMSSCFFYLLSCNSDNI